MGTIKTYFRNSFVSLVVVLQISAFPLTAFAEDAQPSSADAGSTAQTNAIAPTPAQSNSTTQTTETPTPPASSPSPAPEPPPYVLNPETGNYENDKYIWDPNTYQTTPKNTPDYSYNPKTGIWETTDWAYNPESKEYAPNIPVSPSPESARQLSTNPYSSNLPESMQNQSNIYPYGDVKNNDSTGSDFFNGYYNAQISNNIYSSARSGDATVAQNTVGGNALSGNATAVANLINILQSSFSPGLSGNVGTFVANIDGDVIGDIMIDPDKVIDKSLSVSPNKPSSDLKINVENNASINNNIDLVAQSGNSKVSGNTQAGNATTGNATAIANVVNMINSSFAAGDSFFGIVNINGNFNGDILMPPNALDYLLASSAPRTSVDVSKLGDQDLTANLTNNQTINNNVNTSASSGKSSVSGNTSAGNATTGNANTNVTIMNLTGSNIIGSNALLVFVNVLGEWVGLIVNAPAGTSSAAYGGGITKNTLLPGYSDVDVNATNNNTINNNINVAAKSGDATVEGNTVAGDATSGDAVASVNLTNIMNSNLSFTNWFGILFINVLGSWHGSFGVNTSAGNPIVTHQNNKSPKPRAVSFVPGNAENGTNSSLTPSQMSSLYGNITEPNVLTVENDNPRVLLAGSSTSNGPNGSGAGATVIAEEKPFIDWGLILVGFTALIIAFGAYRTISIIRFRRHQQLVG